MTSLKYTGFRCAVNKQPKGDWIEIWVSDWNIAEWGFYAYISLDRCEEDLKAINALIRELNWRDGDIYVELINHSEGLRDFYHRLYSDGSLYHNAVLFPETWRELLKSKTEGEKRKLSL